MKKFAVIITSFLLFGCGSSSNKTNTIDTMNGVSGSPALDTQPSPSMNGYAPPNTTTDTSQRVKDSIKDANKK